MKSRRDFVKLLGGGAIASLFAGHVLAKQIPAAQIPAAQVPAAQVPAAQVPAAQVPALQIWRLAQPPAYPVYTDKVQAGHWYTHDHETKEYTDFGSMCRLQSIHYTGMKAIFLPDWSPEKRSCQVFTDPSSADFKQIVRIADQVRSHTAFYGPVYRLNHKGLQYELFCSSKSMRRFAAANEIGSSGKTNVILTSKLVSTGKFSWFVPSLCD